MSSKQQAQRTRRKARSRNNILRRIQTSVLYLTTNCKIFDQKKVAFSEHHHVTRNKTSTERCEKWPATQVPAFQFHSPQTLFIKVPLTGAIFTTRHEGETQSRANSRIETQKKREKPPKTFACTCNCTLRFRATNKTSNRTEQERKEAKLQFTGKQRPGLTKYRHQLLMHLEKKWLSN